MLKTDGNFYLEGHEPGQAPPFNSDDTDPGYQWIRVVDAESDVLVAVVQVDEGDDEQEDILARILECDRRRVVIVIDGGLVIDVKSDGGRIEYVVENRDVEGLGEEEVTECPTGVEAFVRSLEWETAEVDFTYIRRMAHALAVKLAEEFPDTVIPQEPRIAESFLEKLGLEDKA